jgi:hypothetical protein
MQRREFRVILDRRLSRDAAAEKRAVSCKNHINHVITLIH